MLSFPIVVASAAETETPPADPVEELSRQLAEHQAALEALEQRLAEREVAAAVRPPVTVGWEGHYRVRGVAFDGLWEEPGEGAFASVTTQRLWLRPRLEVAEAARLWVELRALDDVAFGRDGGLPSAPSFVLEPEAVGVDGEVAPTLEVGRVWTEVALPFGAFRLGRQPSSFGWGLLVGPGDATDADFGDPHWPTTSDRAELALRPGSLVAAALGTPDRALPLTVSLAVEHLVEDPAGPVPRAADWWADPGDDRARWSVLAAWRSPPVRELGRLDLDLWVADEAQRADEVRQLLVDASVRAATHGLSFDGELAAVDGRAGAERVSTLGWAARAGAGRRRWRVAAEVGSASGDAAPGDDRRTARSLHPDHNVGLVVYEEVLAAITAAARPAEPETWSRGGVVSSRYVFPTAHVAPIEPLELVVGGLVAWPDRPDGVVLRCRVGDPCDAPGSERGEAATLGWELDGAVKVRWAAGRLGWSVESALAGLTDRVPVEVAGLDPGRSVFTVQSRFLLQL